MCEYTRKIDLKTGEMATYKSTDVIVVTVDTEQAFGTMAATVNGTDISEIIDNKWLLAVEFEIKKAWLLEQAERRADAIIDRIFYA